ncbi:MAG: carboxypeptidase regulatory-like domain-containing protein [Muribaculaceae bacterium]|nr:carboxypeptidase regulatory-like domain-containing protein [Muribaculaceae bacterium]
MLKKLLFVAAMLLVLGMNDIYAQRIQVVDTDGQPIAYVCVTNANGALVGSTDSDGWIEDVKGASVLSLSHVAFQDKSVRLDEVLDGKIVMEEVDFTLPDVEVKPKELAYVQTYFRLIYLDEEGPIYYRGGVVDNTYEFAKKKASSKTRSLSKGANGLIRFLLSSLVGGRIDKLGQMHETSTYKDILEYEEKGKVTLTDESPDRRIVSDSICTLGYIDVDKEAGTRTTSFDKWTFREHIKAAEDRAKGKKMKKEEVEENETGEDSFYEVYRIDSEGRSRIDDFVMRQLQVGGTFKRTKKQYMILMQAYATERDYIDKKDYKALRKENKVDMDIKELRQYEKAHNIPPLAPNVQAQVDKLFEKELAH